MKRRDFLGALGGAALSSLGAGAQQAPMPVIGFLRNTNAESSAHLLDAFRRGLEEMGYVEGRNVVIEYRWAEGQDGRLPALAAELAKLNVTVIVAAGGSATALAAKAATRTIPVVFELGGDPVTFGLVPNLNQPGGNVTGIALFAAALVPKRVELLHNLAPRAGAIGLLLNPSNPNAATETGQAQAAAQSLGKTLHVLHARTIGEIDAAFAALPRLAGALVVTANPLFVSRRTQMVELAAHHRLPTIYPFRNFADAGGLMSYGDSLTDAFRHTGNYTGRVLKGEKPGDLPVVRPSKFEFVINIKTAKSMNLEIPPTLLALADEVIE